MTIKAIVCDMDGTLLRADHTIDADTRNLLIGLQESGVKLILASGRSYIRLMPDALKLKMDQFGGYLIDVNGSSVYDFSSAERIRLGLMEESDIQDLNNIFKNFNVEIIYSQDAALYTYLPEPIFDLKKRIRGEMRLPDDYPWVGGMYGWLCDMRDGYPEQHLILDLDEAPKHCNKVTITQDPHYMETLRKELDFFDLEKDYELVFSDERKLEINKKGINKGNALNVLLEKLAISNDEIAVFGDSENDLSMLQGRSFSFAMDNALPNAKNAAAFITRSNDEAGVHYGLKKLMDSGEL